MTFSKQDRLVLLNVFRPKPGMMEAFIEGQLGGLPRFGHVAGLVRSHLYRAHDDRDAILVSEWESEAAQRVFAETPAFHEHRARLQPLLDGASPGLYTLVYERNAVESPLHPTAASTS